jgi:predicted PurR-regulated permease PerM
MINFPVAVSYLIFAILVPTVLYFKLLPAVIAGLAVHVLTTQLAGRLPKHWTRVAREVALAALVTTVMLLVLGAGFGLWSFLRGHGLAALLAAAAGTLDRLRQVLPPDMADAIPTTVEDLREQVAVVLRQYGTEISVAGLEGVKLFAHILLGMVIGGMTSLHHFREKEGRPSLAGALHQRVRSLMDAFEKVVFAQLSISLLNTVLTAIFLFLVLPLFGVHLPMRTVLIVLTFLCGMLPVVGNLVSNLVIVLISLGMSPAVGAASLAFLIAIHKLEYFTNAKIVGGKVHASAWELLCSMLLMEAVFGLGGLVAAPVVYAWIKSELKAKELI